MEGQTSERVSRLWRENPAPVIQPWTVAGLERLPGLASSVLAGKNVVKYFCKSSKDLSQKMENLSTISLARQLRQRLLHPQPLSHKENWEA
jgi:hypothetical protein